MNAIVIRSLSKRFGATQALTGITCTIGEGERFGLIGPDGSGKTTLIRILATLLLPDEGSVQIFTFDLVREYRQIRRLIGYMPSRFSLYADLTVDENLSFYASIFGVRFQEGREIIRPLYEDLRPFRFRRAGHLSGGMKQKLALCCALIHHPRLLILDEPTTGVDAVSRFAFWETLDQLKKAGITILVSTPYMAEANRCDRVGLMQGGRLLAVKSPEGLLARYDLPLFAIRGPDRQALVRFLRNLSGIAEAHAFGDAVHVAIQKEKIEPVRLREILINRFGDGVTLTPIQPTVEDCFLRLLSSHE